jgi:diguanylate cyclase (GGDEF)-like protein/PAS domain S-box-containing protein
MPSAASLPRKPLAVLLAGVVLYAISHALGDAAAGWRPWVSPALYLGIAALIAGQARRRATDRVAWFLVAAGVASYATGSAIYALTRPGLLDASAAAHAGWFGFYAFAYVAVFLLLRSRMPSLAPTLALDGLAGALAIAAVAAVFIVEPLRGVNGINDLDAIAGLGYAGADILLLALVLWAAWLAGRSGARMWLTLASGVGMVLASDLILDLQTVFGGFQPASMARALYPLGFLVIAAAACQPAVTGRRPRIDSLAMIVIPGICVAIALAILGFDRFAGITIVAYGLVLLVLAVAFIRAVVTYRQLRRLKEGQRFLRGFEDATIGMALVTYDARWLKVNDALCQMLGRTVDELVGRHIARVIHPGDHAALSRSLDDAEGRMLHADGSTVEIRCSTVFVDDDGDHPYVFAQIQDVTERNRAERHSAVLAELGRMAIDSTESAALLARAMPLIAGAVDADAAMVVTSDQPTAPLALSVPLRRRDQVLVAERHTPADPVDERFLQAVADVLTGALDRADTEAETRRRALHDVLTGLANRAQLTQFLGEELRAGDGLTVLLLDVDRFKLVNDTLGHTAGDELLREVALRLLAVTRAGDLVARLGGDEFVVAGRALGGDEGATGLAGRIVEAFRQPFLIADRELVLGTSVGVATAGPDAATADALLRDADVAMYRAKESGGGQYVVFDADLRAKVVQRMTLEVAMRGAVERGELLLHYQPIVALEGERIVGFEALVRWQHPELGLVEPDDFIGIAEETGLIRPIGAWVLEEAARQLGEWNRGRAVPLQMGVNLSAVQLEPELVTLVKRATERHRLAPGTLVLEITESLLLHTRANDVIAALRGHGAQIVLDDFGTGYSSLGYLTEYSLDAVKLDRSLIAGLGESIRAQGLVRGIIEMADALGLTVLAEGLESERQVVAARAAGCDLGQGWYFAPALPAAEAVARLATAVG